MTALAEKISREAPALSEVERAEIIHQLLRSIDGPNDPDAQEAWDVELQFRLRNVESGQAKGRPATDVLAEIREQFRR